MKGRSINLNSIEIAIMANPKLSHKRWYEDKTMFRIG